MRTATSADVQGLRELGAALKELGDDIAKKIIFSATLAGASAVKKRAQEIAPRSERSHRVGRSGPVVQPGHLANGLATKRLKSNTAGVAQYEVRWKAKKKGDPFYGLFIEFGTAKSKAQPFMRPAFDQSKDAALAAITSKLKARIALANKKV
jgi:HK97 gp10 family phage protein